MQMRKVPQGQEEPGQSLGVQAVPVDDQHLQMRQAARPNEGVQLLAVGLRGEDGSTKGQDLEVSQWGFRWTVVDESVLGANIFLKKLNTRPSDACVARPFKCENHSHSFPVELNDQV